MTKKLVWAPTPEWANEIPVATYCTWPDAVAENGEGDHMHRWVLIWDREPGGEDGPFWACTDCDPNAVARRVEVATGD